MKASALRELLFTVGYLLVVCGSWMLHPAAGCLVGGSILMLGSLVGHLRGRQAIPQAPPQREDRD